MNKYLDRIKEGKERRNKSTLTNTEQENPPIKEEVVEGEAKEQDPATAVTTPFVKTPPKEEVKTPPEEGVTPENAEPNKEDLIGEGDAELIADLFSRVDTKDREGIIAKIKSQKKSFGGGIRESIRSLATKNRALEKKLTETSGTSKEAEELRTQIDGLKEKAENFSKLQKELEKYDFNPSEVPAFMDLLLTAPEEFRKRLEALSPDASKRLFTIEAKRYDSKMTMDKANRFATAGWIDARDSFDSDEEFLEEARKTAEALATTIGVPAIDKDEIVQEITGKVKQELQGFTADMQELKTLVQNTKETVPPTTTEPLPGIHDIEAEPLPIEEKVEDIIVEGQKKIQEYALNRAEILGLQEAELEKISSILAKDEEFIKYSSKEEVDPIKASRRIEVAIDKYYQSKKSQTTMLEEPRVTPTGAPVIEETGNKYIDSIRRVKALRKKV